MEEESAEDVEREAADGAVVRLLSRRLAAARQDAWELTAVCVALLKRLGGHVVLDGIELVQAGEDEIVTGWRDGRLALDLRIKAVKERGK